MNREHHVPPHSTRSALGISNEAVRLRLMAAIVSLRKQVFAHASDSDVSAKPLLRSAAEPNNVHQPRDLPYQQLQTQPGGAALQQRDISSFFRPPIASANSKDADEYVYDIYIYYISANILTFGACMQKCLSVGHTMPLVVHAVLS